MTRRTASSRSRPTAASRRSFPGVVASWRRAPRRPRTISATKTTIGPAPPGAGPMSYLAAAVRCPEQRLGGPGLLGNMRARRVGAGQRGGGGAAQPPGDRQGGTRRRLVPRQPASGRYGRCNVRAGRGDEPATGLVDAVPHRARRGSDMTSGRPQRDRPDVMPDEAGGGCGIRTREGLPPTRFPSVRHRPTRRILRAREYLFPPGESQPGHAESSPCGQYAASGTPRPTCRPPVRAKAAVSRRLLRGSPCGGTLPNSPRAGRQQG